MGITGGASQLAQGSPSPHWHLGCQPASCWPGAALRPVPRRPPASLRQQDTHMWPERREATGPVSSHRSPACSSREEGPRVQFKRTRGGFADFILLLLAMAAALAARAGPRGPWRGKPGKRRLRAGWGGVRWQMIPPGCCLLILGQITPHLGTHLGTHLAPGR